MKDTKLMELLEELIVKAKTYSKGGNGQKNVTAAGTPERISDQDLTCAGLYIQAKTGNTGLIYWGFGEELAKSTSGIELDIGAAIWIPIDNVNKVWIDAAVNGEGICWAIVV